jgi:pSer/pThr/pTyr-binding forkhead associated (FHA) protein
MTAMSLREGRRPRTFLCRDELYDAFEARARELQCSVDWLLGEAMKRLLADGSLAPPPRRPPPPVRSAPPLGPPPLPRRPTGSFVGPKPQPSPTAIALRLGETRVVVDRARFVIGRSARDAQLPIRDGNVSRQHALVERSPTGYAIVDMASTNGVLLNGTRVLRAELRPGDVIGIGPFAIHVERA